MCFKQRSKLAHQQLTQLIPQTGATHVPSTLHNIFMHNGLRES